MKIAKWTICCVFVLTSKLGAAESPIKFDDNLLRDRHYWHCTAYDYHGHGFSHADVHYEHAYHGAVQRCEQATGHHCHDVHCHQDH